MGQVITAMFNTRAEAEAVQNQLRSLGIIKDEDGSSNRGSVLDRSHQNYRADHYSDHDDHGIWAGAAGHDRDGHRLPDQDRHQYEEGIHRGHTLLTVEVDDEMAGRAREIIDKSDAFDVDAKASEWHAQGAGAASRPVSAPASSGGSHTGSSGGRDYRYYQRDTAIASTRYRSYRTGAATGAGAAGMGNGPGEASYNASGMANEAVGNMKQAAGSALGNEGLRQSGAAQERKGEGQYREGDSRGDRGNEL